MFLVLSCSCLCAMYWSHVFKSRIKMSDQQFHCAPYIGGLWNMAYWMVRKKGWLKKDDGFEYKIEAWTKWPSFCTWVFAHDPFNCICLVKIHFKSQLRSLILISHTQDWGQIHFFPKIQIRYFQSNTNTLLFLYNSNTLSERNQIQIRIWPQAW